MAKKSRNPRKPRKQKPRSTQIPQTLRLPSDMPDAADRLSALLEYATQDMEMITGNPKAASNRLIRPVVPPHAVNDQRTIPTGGEDYPYMTDIETWVNEISTRRGSQPTPIHGIIVFSGVHPQFWKNHYLEIFVQIRAGETDGVISRGDGRNRAHWDFIEERWQDTPHDQYRRYVARWDERLRGDYAAEIDRYTLRLHATEDDGKLVNGNATGLIEWVMGCAAEAVPEGYYSRLSESLYDMVLILRRLEEARAVSLFRGTRDTEAEKNARFGTDGWVLNGNTKMIVSPDSSYALPVTDGAYDQVRQAYNQGVIGRRMAAGLTFTDDQLQMVDAPIDESVAAKPSVIENVMKNGGIDRINAIVDAEMQFIEKTDEQEP